LPRVVNTYSHRVPVGDWYGPFTIKPAETNPFRRADQLQRARIGGSFGTQTRQANEDRESVTPIVLDGEQSQNTPRWFEHHPIRMANVC
jgi:hypothetical protein